MTETQLKDVFISYSKADEAFVNSQLLPVFDRHEITYFLDAKDLEAGQFQEFAILGGLKNSSRFLVVISATSVESDWVTLEVKWALKHRHTNGGLISLVLPGQEACLDMLPSRVKLHVYEKLIQGKELSGIERLVMSTAL